MFLIAVFFIFSVWVQSQSNKEEESQYNSISRWSENCFEKKEEKGKINLCWALLFFVKAEQLFIPLCGLHEMYNSFVISDICGFRIYTLWKLYAEIYM